MPEILFTPMIFLANVLMGRRRNTENVHLRKIVPVEIETASAEDAPMVANLAESGHLRQMGGRLLVPLCLHRARGGLDDVVTIATLKSVVDDHDVIEASQGRSREGEFKKFGLPNAPYVSSSSCTVVLPVDDPSIRSDIAESESRAYAALTKGYAEMVCVDGTLYASAGDVSPLLTVLAERHRDGFCSGIRTAHGGKIYDRDNARDGNLVFSLFDKHHFGSAFDDDFRWGNWSGMDAVGGLRVAERFFVETLPTNMKAIRRQFEDLFWNVKPMECSMEVLSILHEYRNDQQPLWDSSEERDMLEVLAAVAVHSDALASFFKRSRTWDDYDDGKSHPASNVARMARMVMVSVVPHQAHVRKSASSRMEILKETEEDDVALSMGM